MNILLQEDIFSVKRGDMNINYRYKILFKLLSKNILNYPYIIKSYSQLNKNFITVKM